MHDGALLGSILIDRRYDQQIRWRKGERLDHLFEAQADLLRALGHGDRLAIDSEDASLTYDGLEARANQVARYLARQGVRSGDRVALLCDRAVHAYTGMLAILKLNAAYVPLDPGFPPDRLAYICEDAGVGLVLTNLRLVDLLGQVGAPVVCVDAATGQIDRESAARLTEAEKGAPVSELAYVIYTSGSTGRPKGVAIEHAGICNFVRVAAEVYGVSGRDRVYQGMTVAFDFSVEEIWVPWMVGATLVPKPSGGALVGQELWDFLVSRRITALCCVPTLLATLENDVPDLRFLLVSGEPCPQDLIARWHRPERRFLNVYGPTEASVTATWTQLTPERQVTIGVPLPTYTIVLLDPESDRVVPRGEVGEICIAGVCLATGYLNRPDLTAKAFIDDPHQIPNNPSGRLYRTGDLGRIDEAGELEYHGRIDLQVKVRGYRIELTEIESVLLQVPGIATAVVEPYRPEPGVVELVAYYSRRSDAPMIHPAELKEALRDRLPGYMVPAYYEELVTFPLMASNKVDRLRLPPPDTSRRPSGAEDHAAPDGPVEQVLAEMLAGVLRLERVSVTAHFFDDLGANSLLMARFCARVRECPGLVAPVMKDVYLHPSVRSLAQAIQPRTDPSVHPAGEGPGPDGDPSVAPGVRRATTARYVACGAAQLVTYAGFCWVAAAWMAFLLQWWGAAANPVELYLYSVGWSLGVFGFLLVFPILAKWVLVGRWTPQDIPAWGLGYLRFWTVRRLIQLNPIRLMTGTPLVPLYLRLLGARIGPRVVMFTTSLPPCPDLLTIGSDTVICKDATLNCYRAEGGVIRTGRVTMGDHAFVGEHAVIDIDTGLGSHSQLGHSSTLLRGQVVPDGEHWHGTPAVPTDADYQQVPPAPMWRFRPLLYGLAKLLVPVLVIGPIVLAGTVTLLSFFPDVADVVLGHPSFAWDQPSTFGFGAAVTLATYLGGIVLAVLVSWTVPRLFHLGMEPGRVYPLFGLRYWCVRSIGRLTNGRMMGLFGDSNYITGYLSRLGYKLKPLVQTGSNFGMVVRHDVPYLVRIGTGTMVSDGLSLMNAEYSSTSFRVRPTTVGKQVFLGNGIVYPPDAKVGDNCLLATKVLLPVTGEVRHDVGLLGAPAFEIPRAVKADREIGRDLSVAQRARALRAKMRYNTVTIGLYLLVHWFFIFLSSVLLAWAIDRLPQYGSWPLALLLFGLPIFGAVYSILVERASQGFRPMQPRTCSIYDPIFWRHERYWKLSGVGALWAGTPFASWIWRALGVKVGRRLFDDGCAIIEKSLTTLGNDVTLNAGSTLQGHSLEEGAFKSDRIVIGDECTIGVIAFVHYGTNVGAGSVIEADSFLMKGEEVPAGQRWLGNPAHPAGPIESARVPLVSAAVPVTGAVSVPAGAAVEVPAALPPGPSAAVPPVPGPSGQPGLAVPAVPASTDGAIGTSAGAASVTAEAAPRTPTGPRAVRERAEASDLLRRLRAPGEPVCPGFAGVDVRLFSVAACAAHEADLFALLGPEDQAEATRFTSRSRRLRFTSSRALAGLILAERDRVRSRARPVPGGPPAASRWWLSTAPGGRPVVHGPGPSMPRISLAYSDELIAVALADDLDVGIDLASAADAAGGIVQASLSEAEQRSLARLGLPERRWTFLRLWTVKEAAAKCLGAGFTLTFSDLDTVRGVRPREGGQFGYAFGNLRHLRFHQEIRGSGPYRHWLTVAVRPLEVGGSTPSEAGQPLPSRRPAPQRHRPVSAEALPHAHGHARGAPSCSSLQAGTKEGGHGRGRLQHRGPGGRRHRGLERHRPGDRHRAGPGRRSGRLRSTVGAGARRYHEPHRRHRRSGHHRPVGRHRSRARRRSRRGGRRGSRACVVGRQRRRDRCWHASA